MGFVYRQNIIINAVFVAIGFGIGFHINDRLMKPKWKELSMITKIGTNFHVGISITGMKRQFRTNKITLL